MIEHINLNHILFLDIETVPAHPNFAEVPKKWQELWATKAKSLLKAYDRELSPEEVEQSYERAGIYAEFGRIVCISVGFVTETDKGLSVRVKSYASKEEKELLEGFGSLLNQYYNNPSKHFICGHNIKEFDIPYICRRMLIHGMKLPRLLDVYGKKPWELDYFLDTMILWKFGDYKAYTKLSLLTAVFQIPTPKDDIDGSEVRRVFWEDDDLERIAIYCEKDVVATAQLLMKYRRMELPENLAIERVK